METKLFYTLARATGPVVLRDIDDIAAFASLRERLLAVGAISTDASGASCAIVQGLTLDGRALLALQECRRRRMVLASLLLTGGVIWARPPPAPGSLGGLSHISPPGPAA